MSRLAARRAAVQLIYEQMLGGAGGDDTLLGLIAFSADDAPDDDFVRALVEGVTAHGAQLDAEISSRSANRELQRIPYVSRAILRAALYELMYIKDSPPSVVVNEAVELARRFAEEGDGRFINGVLGSYLRESPVT